MTHFIEIIGVGPTPLRFKLSGNSATIGSSRACQIPIPHREVSEHALVLDIRGNDFWVQNLNSYPIYVGMDEVAPNTWSPWSSGETIQLTRSVSLTIVTEEDATAEGDAAAAKKSEGDAKGFDFSKWLQILIIIGCFTGAPILLFADKDEVTGVIDKQFDFNEVVRNLESRKNDVEFETLKKYLQQAWMSDRRWRKKSPATVMKYYELLVNHRLVRENPTQDEIVASIGDYAKRRLSELRFDQ